MRVVVIGAGPGGLTLAHGLRRAGIDVAVYERDGELGRPQGISLHIDERGMSALRACLPPAQAATVEATAGGLRERTLELSEVDGRLTVVGTRPSGALPGRQVHRPLLREVLLTGLGDVVRFGAEFERFEHRPDGTVGVWFADGHTDTADVLVGADGIGSTVRRQYLPDVRVVDTGRRMIMGATPLRAVDGTGLSELIGHDPASVRAGGTMMALGVLRFAEPQMVEDYVMWALPVVRERLGSADPWVCAEELAASLPSVLRTVVAEAWRDLTVALRIGTIPPMPPWQPGPVTLIGDAIHLAPGFGANLAMRDARWLSEALAEARRGDLLEAIGGYENTMRHHNFAAVTA
ncbi:FAD-dependent oxidoreductase [Amycolatopsis sp. cg5]|uniref:FAD-dependent oxidoreductase n=1 Tax=Amycolatopsis sp. cg5 TaxID=3238802 RepID=UPI0035236310